MNYSDVVLGLCINADTYDDSYDEGESISIQAVESILPPESAGVTIQKPFDVSILAGYDFRLRPSNFKIRFKHLRSSRGLDWDQIQTWYLGNTLINDLEKKPWMTERLAFDPYVPGSSVEPVVRTPIEPLDDTEVLRELRSFGIPLCPVWVDGDGSCLTNAISTSLVGSQLFYDALRWSLYKELRMHADYYQSVGLVSDEDKMRCVPLFDSAATEAEALGLIDRSKSMRRTMEEMLKFDNATARVKWSKKTFEEALEKARPSEGEILREDRYLEEIHIAALSNLLKRPIMVLAEGLQGGLFLPLRHDPSDCRMPESGRMNPPIICYQLYDHYVPLVMQSPQDFWKWAEETFEGDEAALAALRSYEAARGGAGHRIPEWGEEILTYVAGVVASSLEELLRVYELPAADKMEYKNALGDPAAMDVLPMKFIFEEAPVNCPKTIKSLPEMTQIFRALGLEIEDQGQVARISVSIHKVDFSRFQKMTWALYYLMSSEHVLSYPDELKTPPGILPSEGDKDQSVWKFLLNYTQNDDLNLGLARLYCDPEGWDFRPLSDATRDPTDFLRDELARLEQRFTSLTGLEFKIVLEEDLQSQLTVATSTAPLDIRHKLPKALLALQTIIKTKPYPGRGTLSHSQIFIESLPQGMAITTVSMADVKVAKAEERRELLRHLLLRGLRQNQEFEQVACSCLLTERFNEVRTRFVFAEWILHAASTQASPPPSSIEIERGPTHIRKITVRPLAEPYPLPRLAALFPEVSCLAPSSPGESYVLVPTHLEPPLLSLFRSSSATKAAKGGGDRTSSPGLDRSSPFISRWRSARQGMERRDSGASDLAPSTSEAEEMLATPCAGREGPLPVGDEEEGEELGFALVPRGQTY